jgi:hypothetical protein
VVVVVVVVVVHSAVQTELAAVVVEYSAAS